MTESNVSHVAKFLEAMPAFRHFGMTVESAQPGEFVVRAAFAKALSYEAHSFPAAIVSAAADFAAGAACASLLPPGTMSSTIGLTVAMVAPAVGDAIVARGRSVRAGKAVSVGTCEVYVVKGDAEILCATAIITMRNPPAR